MGGAAAIVLAGANGVQQPSQADEEHDDIDTCRYMTILIPWGISSNDMRKGLKTLLKSTCAQGS